jgi:hypothetical protein
MQTDIAHAAEDDEIIVSVVSISADLALGVLILPLSFLLFDVALHLGYLLLVLLLSVCLHVLQILLLLGMELVDEF